MTSPPVTVGPDQPVQRAARLMYDRRVKRLPVVNDAGRLVGIISRADVLSVFRRADEEIRCEATDQVILGRFLMHPDSMTVTVRDGILTISGRPENRRRRPRDRRGAAPPGRRCRRARPAELRRLRVGWPVKRGGRRPAAAEPNPPSSDVQALTR